MSILDASQPEIPQPEKSLLQRATTPGLYAAGAGIVVGLIFYVTGLDMEMITNSGLNWFNRLLLMGLTYYFIHVAIKQRRQEDLGGYLSVGQGIGLGTLAGLVSGVVSAVWFYIFTTFIATDMLDKIKEISIEEMQKKGQSAEQAEQAMEMMSSFFSPGFMAVMVIIFSIIIGLLCGLVGGLILKREKSYM